MKFTILLTAVFLFSIQAQAKALPNQSLAVETPSAVLRGHRFLNADGKPGSGKWVLFTHGLASNYHEFEYLIPLFLNAGYDCFAFNFRGHGNGDERSLARDYREGDYRLEKMAEEDFPAMVAEVQKLHGGGKGLIVGHSMGGMVPRGSFANGLVGDRQIEAMILLGSPPHFESARRDRNSQDLFGMLGAYEGWLNAGPGNADLNIARTRDTLENILDFTNFFSLGYWISKGVIQSILKREAQRVFGPIDWSASDNWPMRAMSGKIPKDILRSFAGYTRGDYPYADVKIPVPILHIMGERDILVKHEDIASHAARQSEDGGYWLARVKGVGHLGLVAPRAIEAYRETLFDFLKTEGSVGSSHKSYYELTPGSCARRLVTPENI